mmetsp:Transcript_7597/g.17287  ORF Transcript_7597/g.17287 Transcript_7597/m.17287 type:complete len:212 (+) Transcript_7597:37-672(+)
MSFRPSLSLICFAASVMSAVGFVVPLTQVRALAPARVTSPHSSLLAAGSSIAAQTGGATWERKSTKPIELVQTSVAALKHQLSSLLLLFLLGFCFSRAGSMSVAAAPSLSRSDVQLEQQVVLTASSGSMAAAAVEEEDFSEWKPTTRTDLLKMHPHEQAAKKDFKHPMLELVVNLLKVLFPVFLIGLPIYIVFPWSLITDGHKGSNKKWLN